MNISKRIARESGGTIIVAIVTTLALSAFVGLAVDYTSNISRNAERDRVYNNAVEIGDGCLELAYGAWRDICKNTAQLDPPTSTFYGINPIPTPSPGNFPMVSNFTVSRGSGNYTVTNYQVQAVDPMMTLTSVDPPVSALPTASPPPKCTGPGEGTFSFFYLASADVKLPYAKGTLTAKVRRVFEKRYTSAWNWAMMYNDDLELHPDSKLTLTGWVHSNKDVYVGNGTTSSSTPPPNLTLTDRLSYAGNYAVGFASSDGGHAGQGNLAAPVTPANLPPGHEQVYAPLGWDPGQFNTTDGNADNDSYHEMIEKPVTPWASGSTADPFKDRRLYNQAGIVVEIDASNNIKVYRGALVNADGSAGSRSLLPSSDPFYNDVTAAIKTNKPIQDYRETSAVRLANFDVNKFKSKFGTSNFNNPANGTQGWNGIIYITDTSAGSPVTVTPPGGSAQSTTKRGIRLINSSLISAGGMTVVSDNPVYLQGDFNTGNNPASNSGDPTKPEGGTYTREPASIIADAVTLLSNNWNDSNTSSGLSSRIASNTTINAALIAGNVPSGGSYYSGGGENFTRFLEDWTGKTFTYYGSMLGLYASAQATGPWGGNLNTYKPPQQYWYFDSKLSFDENYKPVTVPGSISTVAYLQQQRWYLQY
jgi:hypothetical protein